MTDRTRVRNRLTALALGGASAAVVVAAVIVAGPSNAAGGGSGERLVTVARGVVQTTVSGSGTVAAATQLDVGFETGGTLEKVYVKPGQHVVEGQVLARLDTTEAQEALDDAEQSLADAQSGNVTTTGASASTASGETTSARAAAVVGTAAGASSRTAVATSAANPEGTDPSDGADGDPDPTQTTPTTTTPAPDPPKQTPTPTTPAPQPMQTTPAAPSTVPVAPGGGSGGGAGAGGGAAGGGAGATATASSAQLDDLQNAVDDAQTTLAATTLRAPIAGTVASVGASAGETVAANGTSAAGTASGSGGASGSGTTAGAGGATGGSGSSSTSGGASSAFVVLVDLDAMNVVVPFSESDVGQIRRGQVATVTVNALPGEQLAAHVVSVATLPGSSSSVVSYDVTLRLDQLADGLKPGMTASANVVVEQAEGVLNVASAAVSGRGSTGTVTVADGDRREQRRVSLGLVGDATTQILDGLAAGDQLAVAAAPTSTAGSGGAAGAGAQRGAAGALGGGGAGFPGGGMMRGGGGPPGGP